MAHEPATDVAVSVQGLSKQFRVPSEQMHTIKERVLHPLRTNTYETLHALRDISFDVAAGEFFGIVGRNGEVILQVRGDNTNPHTVENSMRKAYTARTTRAPSGNMAKRVKEDPTLGFIHLTNIIANQGALPIKLGDEVIGGAGASGAPGGEKDEACIKAGLDKVADQLK